MSQAMNKSVIRNLVIFGLAAASAGWIGLGLNHALGLTDPTQNLGMLVFLLLPFVTGLLLRAVGGDGWADIGWKPNLRPNAVGYGVALLSYPLMTVVVLAVGYLAGGITFAGFAQQGVGAFFAAVGLTFAADLVKNVLEEFAWRGYLTPRLKATGLPDLLNHLLTGMVWAIWHVPYWLFLLDKSTLADFTAVSLAVFIPLSLANIVTSAFLYGEVRLLTGSTWAAVLLHTTANAVTLTLLLEDFVAVHPTGEIWFTPGGFGILGIALVLLAGLGLHIYRIRRRNR